MNARGKSDDSIVPLNPANKGGAEPPAESAEGRESARRNSDQPNLDRTQSRKRRSRGLLGVREAAHQSRELKFTALLHHIGEELLTSSFYWINQWRQRHARGGCVVVRYADDFVIGFEHEADARACLEALRERLAKFGLNLHPEKTRLIEFGRGSAAKREREGRGKCKTFDFLGFTHACGKTRHQQRFALKRNAVKHFDSGKIGVFTIGQI